MFEIYLLNSDIYEGVKNLPVIEVGFFEKEVNLQKYDALIFTSKNGVRAIDRLDKSWKSMDIYSIGSGTSKEIERLGAEPKYTAKSSYGDDFAKEIQKELKDKRVLFIRAKVVTSKLNQILKKSGVLLEELILYETLCKTYSKNCAPKEGSVIIFTSPSTIECFFRSFDWDSSYKALCIGKVTAKAMPLHVKYKLCEKQTIPSCIESAKKIY